MLRNSASSIFCRPHQHIVGVPPPSSVMARPQCHGALACLSLSLLLLLLPGAIAATSSYSSLCGTPAPASDLPAGHRSDDDTTQNTLPDISTGHFSGGDDLTFAPDESYVPRSFYFYYRRTPIDTDDPAVQQVFARLTLEGTHALHGGRHSVSFNLDGYYSTAASSSSGSSELCMVGAGRYAREDGFGSVVLSDVVLRLHVPRPANLSRPFVTGRLEGAGFGAVTLVAYADGSDYEFGEAAASCPAPSPSSRARFPRQVNRAGPSCHRRLKALLRGTYNLEYGLGGHNSTSGSPLLRLPHRNTYFNQIRCGRDGKVRAYMVFDGNTSSDAHRWSNYTTRDRFLVGDEALVAEGSWNTSRRQLCLRACRVMRSGPSRADLAVGDCGIGVSLWFPTVWSIRNRSVAAGVLWNTSSSASGGDTSNKSAGVISVSRSASYTDDVSYIKYKYTRVEEAKKLLDSMLASGTRKEGSFPGNYSYRDFAFFFNVEEHGLYGYASPVSIGSAVVLGDRLTAYEAFYGNWTAETEKHRLMNVSYDVQFYVGFLNSTKHISPQWLSRQQRISAEGVYDTLTGSLCMVGCQAIGNGSSDCEVLVTAQFAPVDAVGRDRVSGTVSSLRKQGDPLFFDALDFAAEGMYALQVEESVSRMDMEGIMVAVSMTLSCVFTGLQLLHVKRHPEALPATSVTMLVVLALGYAVPLVVNLEALFKDTDDGSRSKHFVRLTSDGGLLELNELMLRVSSLVAFVLQLRLLQLALSSRRPPADAEAPAAEGGNDKQEAEEHSSSAPSSSDAERSTLWTCLPMYSLGAILVWIVHLNDAQVAVDGPWNRASTRAIADHLAAYAGLILDGFLLPQVVWNAFAGAKVQALSPWFYAGGAAVRAAPHAYDVYRRRSYVGAPSSYVYASPRDDLFGVAWDIAVPCGVALLAVLLFLQQRLGGAFLCGVRGRRPGGYETVSTLSS